MMKNALYVFLIAGIALGSVLVAQSKKATKEISPKGEVAGSTKPLVTFIELGSVNCIPCKAMQPVMKAIETKYGNQIKIIFYDVWKPDQSHFAEQYRIQLIPTQVFLDAGGKELMRHEGFFPEAAIDAFLQSQGLKAKPSEKG